MIIHTVKAGESLGSVAARYGASPLKLAAINGLRTDELIEGEELLVLIPTRTANARRGENLSELARRYGVRQSSLLLMNPELSPTGELYDGQPITVRSEPPLFGLGIGNGYLYRGASREELMRAMPYMSYLTVASAVGRRGGIYKLFEGAPMAELARAAGRLTLLRLYLAEGENLSAELLRSAALMARSEGYDGLTLAGMPPYSPLLCEGQKMLSELELKLVLELDAAQPIPDSCPCDFTVLSYDKIHLDSIPAPEVGEESILGDYAERHNAVRTFIDLSPFAYSGGKYVTKDEMRRALLSRGGKIGEICRGTKIGVAGKRGREREWVFESLTGVQGRLKLLSELGYYGISFDVARTPIAELMMFGTMFSAAMCLGAAPSGRCASI